MKDSGPWIYESPIYGDQILSLGICSNPDPDHYVWYHSEGDIPLGENSSTIVISQSGLTLKIGNSQAAIGFKIWGNTVVSSTFRWQDCLFECWFGNTDHTTTHPKSTESSCTGSCMEYRLDLTNLNTLLHCNKENGKKTR